MPNWCSTRIVAELIDKSDKSDLHVLEGILKQMQSFDRKANIPNIPEKANSNWVGFIPYSLNSRDEKGYYRGFIYLDDIQYYDDYIQWDEEDAWGPCMDLIHSIQKALPNLKIYYIAEEPGCELYETNDVDNKYFHDNYKVDYYFKEGDHHRGDVCYFETFEELNDFMYEIVQYRFKTVHAINSYMMSHINSEEDEYFYCYEFDKVDY